MDTPSPRSLTCAASKAKCADFHGRAARDVHRWLVGSSDQGTVAGSRDGCLGCGGGVHSSALV